MNNPKGYSQHLTEFVDITREIYRKYKTLLKWDQEPEAIMDIGVGDGRMTNEVILHIIPNIIKEYCGSDISNNMLVSAKETVRHPQFNTIQMDAATQHLPQQLRNRFHHVFANYLFHHVNNIR